MPLLVLVLVVLVGCSKESGTTSSSGETDTQQVTKVKTQVLKFAFNQSENHPQYKVLKEFGEKLYEQTGGAYKLDISPNALLGDQRATAELVQSGAIQMATAGNPIVENFNQEFAVIGLPYIYDSQDHQKEVFTSGVLDDLFASTRSNGFIVAGAFTAGSRNVYTDKPVTSPADLKGYKVRVMQSDTMKRMFDLMGGVGTPMAQSEVYTAIQQGVLDGGENNEVTYVDLKHYEVAPYFSYTQHLMVPDLILINTSIYDKMSTEHRATFHKLMNEAVEKEFSVWNENVASAKSIAIENGATFIDVDIKPFQQNVKPLHDDVTSKSSGAQKLYDAIRALAK